MKRLPHQTHHICDTLRSLSAMGKKIVFGDDDEALPLAPQEAEENATKVAASEDAQHGSQPSKCAQTIWQQRWQWWCSWRSERYEFKEPDARNVWGPEEGRSSVGGWESILSNRSKRRKRKQRVSKEEDELDASTLALLAENTFSFWISSECVGRRCLLRARLTMCLQRASVFIWKQGVKT